MPHSAEEFIHQIRFAFTGLDDGIIHQLRSESQPLGNSQNHF
jgi:hypothetical protein